MESKVFNNINYGKQLDFARNLNGQEIQKVEYYLEKDETTFSEQPNKYGHSLLNGVNIHTKDYTFSIRNGFYDMMGLSMNIGKTTEFEFIDEDKTATEISWNILNKPIVECVIYWSKIIINSFHGYYPQEIEIRTENESVIISSTEILHGELSDEFTNEMLVIQNQEYSKQLKLGKFGIDNKAREVFDETKLMEKKTGYNKA